MNITDIKIDAEGYPTDRMSEWAYFQMIVEEHIALYTIPQYGDKPSDPLEAWDSKTVVLNIQKYLTRMHNNRRGHGEELRDCAKIAHLAAVLYFKLKKEEDEKQRLNPSDSGD